MGKRASLCGTMPAMLVSVREFFSTHNNKQYAPLVAFVLQVGDTVWLGHTSDVVCEIGMDGFRRTGMFRLEARGWTSWNELHLTPEWQHVFFIPDEWVGCIDIGRKMAVELGTNTGRIMQDQAENRGRFLENLVLKLPSTLPQLWQHPETQETIDLQSWTKGIMAGRNLCDAFCRVGGGRFVVQHGPRLLVSSLGQVRFSNQCAPFLSGIMKKQSAWRSVLKRRTEKQGMKKCLPKKTKKSKLRTSENQAESTSVAGLSVAGLSVAGLSVAVHPHTSMCVL